MGPLPWPPHKEPAIGDPYQKEEIVEYLQFYNIRHLQQHTGELCERLGQANINIDLVEAGLN